MPVKYLSEEFFEQLSAKLRADKEFMKAIKGQIVAAQMLVRDGPDGDITYYQEFDGSDFIFALGEVDNPEVDGEMDYETAVAASKGEIDQQQAMMNGKVKFQGNLVRMMGLIVAFGRLQEIERSLDIAY